MPRRKTTRTQDRTHRINQERQHNRAQAQLDTEENKRAARTARVARQSAPDEEPPF